MCRAVSGWAARRSTTEVLTAGWHPTIATSAARAKTAAPILRHDAVGDRWELTMFERAGR
jgi:hypothetical protein